jgi:hypothetical protein
MKYCCLEFSHWLQVFSERLMVFKEFFDEIDSRFIGSLGEWILLLTCLEPFFYLLKLFANFSLLDIGHLIEPFGETGWMFLSGMEYCGCYVGFPTVLYFKGQSFTPSYSNKHNVSLQYIVQFSKLLSKMWSIFTNWFWV